MLACLAVPSRFRLVRAIAEADRCVGELAISVGLSQSCTTRHLQALAREGLIEGRRDGKRVRFSLSAEAGDAERFLGLVLGGERPPSPDSAPAASGTRVRRRKAKPLSKDEMTSEGRSDSARDEDSGGRPPSVGVPPPEESVGPVMPIRRNDIEDYLL